MTLRRVTEFLSPPSFYLTNEVSKFYLEVTIKPVRRAYVLSTDDTTEFVHQGEGCKSPGSQHSKAGFKLVSTKSLSTAGTRSEHTTGKKEEDNRGLRVKLSHTFTATGVSAPVFVSVSGLTEREPLVQDCPSCVLFLDIAGLCVGGTGVIAGSTIKGCIAFVRNGHDKETDKARFRTYRDRVFLPFVDALRTENDGWQKGDPVEDDMRVVSWSGGDLAEVATTIEEDNLEVHKEKKICANKQSAARSAAEQAADLSKVFKTTILSKSLQHWKMFMQATLPLRKECSKAFKKCIAMG